MGALYWKHKESHEKIPPSVSASNDGNIGFPN